MPTPHHIHRWLGFACLLAITTGTTTASRGTENQNPSGALAEHFRKPGPHEVATLLDEWDDPARNRTVPVKIYYPEDGKGPFPVIVFSHGLGGSRENYRHLGDHWAGHGYVSVHLQHIGSDDSVWKDTAPRERMTAMKKAANFQAFIDRPNDVTFAIDRLEAKNDADGPLQGRLDLDRIGMSGHSFGARTTLSIAGQVFPLPGGREISYADPRVKAALPMSPMPPKIAATHDAAFAKITIPVMHMTGTLDESVIEPDRSAEERLIPYDKTPGPGRYLIVFQGGDHMIFSGRPRGMGKLATGDADQDAAFQELIRLSSTAFWNACLKDDKAAKAWIEAGKDGLSAALGEMATLAHK